MNLIELFQPNFIERADQPALYFEKSTLTFGDLDTQSSSVATALRDRYGLRKGDRAAMYLANCHELVIFYLACLKLGVIVVPMNPLYRDQELTSLLRDAEPSVLLTDGQCLEVFHPLRDRFRPLEHVFLAGVDSGHGHAVPLGPLQQHPANDALPFTQVTGDDAALMVYTSGTTGKSKGAVLTHHNLAANIVALLHCWQWTGRDRFVLALPLFHVHGLCNGLHGALASGCRTHVHERFKAEPVLQTLSEQHGTLFFGVPTMFERLLEAASTGVPVPQTMRLYVSGSAPLAADTFRQFCQIFGHQILERYGMSETLMIASNLYASGRGPGTVGMPLPGVSIRVMRHDGAEADAPGQIGEIQVKGPSVMKMYWNEPTRTAESFTNGWFKTADLGQWDQAGRLIICGRCKELIITGGFNVYPQELIHCLCGHPQIAEAAVIGVSEKLHGQVVKAYIVRTDDRLTGQNVSDHCRSHLASFKVPRSVVFLDRLPRNTMGKIQLQNLPDRDRL